MDLRPYQVSAVESARALFRAGKKKTLLVSPTGSGKTVLFCHIASAAVAKGSRVLVLAHRRELVKQTSDKLNRFGVPHGIIQAGFPRALQRPVQVASVQTLIRNPGQLSRVDLVVVDECHHVTEGNTYSKIFEQYPQAILLGVTATPWRLDGRGLADVFDGHVVVTTPRQLRDEGWLVPVGGWEYEGIDTSRARVRNGEYVAEDLREESTSKRVVGDIISEWLMHAAGKRTVLFASSVEQSQLMAAEFVKSGVPAEHVDGKTPGEERDAILARLRSGQTLVVCNCNVLTEGFDCPELEVCILARPTLSTALALQMIGRVLRPAEGKAAARIHDHAGVLRAHGHPYADRDFSPEKAVKGKRPSAGGEGGESGWRQARCDACKSVISRWPCDACGFAPDPKELKLEYEPAAARREITNDGTVGKRKAESDPERAEKWERRYRYDTNRSDRFAFFQKMVGKHGLQKARRVYFWVSGKREWPDRDWVSELERAGVQA